MLQSDHFCCFVNLLITLLKDVLSLQFSWSKSQHGYTSSTVQVVPNKSIQFIQRLRQQHSNNIRATTGAPPASLARPLQLNMVIPSTSTHGRYCSQRTHHQTLVPSHRPSRRLHKSPKHTALDVLILVLAGYNRTHTIPQLNPHPTPSLGPVGS